MCCGYGILLYIGRFLRLGGQRGVLRPFFPYQISILLLLHVAAKMLHGDGCFALLRLRLSLSFFLHSGEKCLLAGDNLLGLVLLVLGIVPIAQGSHGLKGALYNSTFLSGESLMWQNVRFSIMLALVQRFCDVGAVCSE